MESGSMVCLVAKTRQKADPRSLNLGGDKTGFEDNHSYISEYYSRVLYTTVLAGFCLDSPFSAQVVLRRGSEREKLLV